jgi:archaellum biogenesis protein FlaJ (TadC family)
MVSLRENRKKVSDTPSVSSGVMKTVSIIPSDRAGFTCNVSRGDRIKSIFYFVCMAWFISGSYLLVQCVFSSSLPFFFFFFFLAG